MQPPVPDSQPLRALVIGAGFAGICMGVKLLEAGYTDFKILEKADEIGGTWRVNRYPGCQCDVPSHLYSFSFYPKNDWTRSYAHRAEIHEYLLDCVEHYRLRPCIEFNAGMKSAAYDAKEKMWVVETENGREYRARNLVMGTGGLNVPSLPDIPGIEDFEGRAFHSQQWPDQLDLKREKVGVIGTGASAIQIVPSIAPEVGELHLFQRTPAWVIPKPDYAFSKAELWLYKHLPGFRWLVRFLIYWISEIGAFGFVSLPFFQIFPELLAEWNLRTHIADPGLRRTLTPGWRFGCKRALLSNDYYPALTRENVSVHPLDIRRILPHGIEFIDGRQVPLDVIVYATGFKATEFLYDVHIVGLKGKTLKETWQQGGGEAYLGMTVHGFPNLFMFTGPNTGQGHTSMVFMIEAQCRYMLSALDFQEKQEKSALMVRKAEQEKFNKWVQFKMQFTVWQQGGCKSWYQDAQGKNTVLWPGYTFGYWWRTRKFREGAYWIS